MRRRREICVLFFAKRPGNDNLISRTNKDIYIAYIGKGKEIEKRARELSDRYEVSAERLAVEENSN